MKLSAPLILGALLLSGLASCASGDPDGPGGWEGRRPGQPIGHYPNTFISPAGQPFHAPFGQPYPVIAWFTAADTNHDGRLTPDEFRADSKAFFQSLDLNHDGVLDGSEIENYEQTVAPEILPHIGRLRAEEGMDPNLDFGDVHNTDRPQSSGSHRRMAQSRPVRPANTEPTQGAALFSLLNQPEPVSAADTDFDGHVSLAEFMAAADRHFNRLDTKQQGYLDLAGLPKTPVQEAIEKAARQRARQRRARGGQDAPNHGADDGPAAGPSSP